MKHKLTIGVSNASPKSRVVTYKKVSPEAKVKDVIGDASKVAIIVPGDSVKSVTIEETKAETLLRENRKIPKRNIRDKGGDEG